jgi:hypothetical protein
LLRESAIARGDQRKPAASAEGPTASQLFEQLWDGLADMLGTSATAILLRRAVTRAGQQPRHRKGLDGLVIQSERIEYQYRLPDGWRHARNGRAIDALREVVRELYPLLRELTGEIVVRRLERVDALRDVLPGGGGRK